MIADLFNCVCSTNSAISDPSSISFEGVKVHLPVPSLSLDFKVSFFRMSFSSMGLYSWKV